MALWLKSQVVAIRTTWPAKPKISTVWTFMEMSANPWFRKWRTRLSEGQSHRQIQSLNTRLPTQCCSCVRVWPELKSLMGRGSPVVRWLLLPVALEGHCSLPILCPVVLPGGNSLPRTALDQGCSPTPPQGHQLPGDARNMLCHPTPPHTRNGCPGHLCLRGHVFKKEQRSNSVADKQKWTIHAIFLRSPERRDPSPNFIFFKHGGDHKSPENQINIFHLLQNWEPASQS